MDTSETSIKMCKKAKEIQKLRSVFRKVRLAEMGDIYYIPKTRRVKGYNFDLEEGINLSFGISTFDSTWLPRQDQLQEMLGGLEKGFINFPKWLEHTYGLNYGNYPNGHLHIFKTWEQLWLAFVMKEKYNKVWDGTEWIKEVNNG